MLDFMYSTKGYIMFNLVAVGFIVGLMLIGEAMA